MNSNYDWCGHEGCGAPIERWSNRWSHTGSRHELDLDHPATPQPPIGPVDEGLHMRATRYTEALSVAAAADERIKVLTELLAQHEYYRSQAEQALRSVEGDPQFGTVWSPTGPEPDEHVHALLCLITGLVYRRREYGTGWQRAEHNPAISTSYEWPIQDAGPFIAWNDDYGFDAVLRQARKDQTEFDALHRKLYNEPGYRAENSGYGRPPPAEAIDRILLNRMQQTSEQRERAQVAERKLAQLRRSLERLEPDDTQRWPATQDTDDEVRDVDVIDLQRVHDLLDSPEHGGVV